MTQLKKFKISERCFSSGFSSRQNVLSRERSSLRQTVTKDEGYVDLDKTMGSTHSQVNYSGVKVDKQIELFNIRFSQARPGTTCNKCHKDRPMMIRKPKSNMYLGESNKSAGRSATQMDTNLRSSAAKADSALFGDASLGQGTFDIVR